MELGTIMVAVAALFLGVVLYGLIRSDQRVQLLGIAGILFAVAVQIPIMGKTDSVDINYDRCYAYEEDFVFGKLIVAEIKCPQTTRSRIDKLFDNR